MSPLSCIYSLQTDPGSVFILTRHLLLWKDEKKEANEIFMSEKKKKKIQEGWDVCCFFIPRLPSPPLQIVFPFKVLTALGISAIAANSH